MKHVLLVTLEMIPSAILCGDAPLRYLAERGRIEYRCRDPRRLTGEDLRWSDAVIFVRGDEHLSRQAAATARGAGRYTAYVMDDDLLNIPEGLESSRQYRRQETQSMIRDIMGECRCLLSPSRILLEKYGGDFERAERIEEPAMALPTWTARRSDTVKIGFAGSVDRAGDVDKIVSGALGRILREYRGRVTAEFFGARPEIVDEFALRHIPYQDSYEDYRRTMAGLHWDLALAPMPETEFHRCKHYNKFIEYAACGIPGIYSDAEPYRWAVRNGENGLLCPNTEEGWYAAIRRLVEDEELRRALGAEALREAEGPYSLESVAAAWERLLHSWECEPRDTPELLRYDAIRAQNWLRRGVKKVRELGWQTPAYLWDRLHNRL